MGLPLNVLMASKHGEHYATPEAWAKALLKQRNQLHDDASVDAFLKTIFKKSAEEAL